MSPILFFIICLPAQVWKNIFTNKFSSSGIYRYFNSSVRRVKFLDRQVRANNVDPYQTGPLGAV